MSPPCCRGLWESKIGTPFFPCFARTQSRKKNISSVGLLMIKSRRKDMMRLLCYEWEECCAARDGYRIHVKSSVKTFLPGFGNGWPNYCATWNLWGGQGNILRTILETWQECYSTTLYISRRTGATHADYQIRKFIISYPPLPARDGRDAASSVPRLHVKLC